MDCREAQDRLDACIDGELEAAERETLQGHLDGCADCRGTVDGLRAEDDRLREAFAARRESSAALAERVIAQVRREPPVVPLGDIRPVPLARRWIELTLAAAAGFLIALLLFPPAQPTSRQVAVPVARLTLASGDVEVRGRDQLTWQTASEDALLCPGDAVRTGPDVRCEFLTVEGSLVRVNEKTELKVDSEKALDVAQGQVWVASPPSKSLNVKSGGLAVACSGGKFDVHRQGDAATVTATEGTVELSADGKRQALKQGESLKVVKGKMPKEPELRDLIEATRWINGLLVLKGRDDAELRQRVDELLARIGGKKMSYLYEQEIRSLGDYAVPPLARYVLSSGSHASPAQRRSAMRIVADLAQPWSISDLIQLLADKDPQIRVLAATALKRLTGQTFDRPPPQWQATWEHCVPTHKAWSRWWSEHQKAFPACSTPPERTKNTR